MSPDTLAALISDSGLTLSEFASTVAGRDRRTLQRWLSGEVDIPDAAAEWLTRIERVKVTATTIATTVAR